MQRDFTNLRTDWRRAVECLSCLSPNAKVFCLIHKMDLAPLSERESVLNKYGKLIRFPNCDNLDLQVFGTTLMDASLYQGWSAVAINLTPNVSRIEANLEQLLSTTGAEEVILFELTTFLVRIERIKFQSRRRLLQHQDQA